MKNIAIIIPAQGKNEYHEKGDLAPFGDVSLLQWKLTQVEKIDFPKTIYIATSSKEITDFSRRANVQVINREPDLTLKEMISHSLNGVKEDIILWTHATSPFIGSNIYLECLSNFMNMPATNDSLLTVLPIREYVFYKEKPINFIPQEHLSRRNITPVYSTTNGCFIISKEKASSFQSFIGNNPLFHELDRLSAMEIKDVQDMSIANDLLALYFKNDILNS